MNLCQMPLDLVLHSSDNFPQVYEESLDHALLENVHDPRSNNLASRAVEANPLETLSDLLEPLMSPAGSQSSSDILGGSDESYSSAFSDVDAIRDAPESPSESYTWSPAVSVGQLRAGNAEKKVERGSKKKEEKGYCEECGLEFGRRSDAKRHISSKHEKELYPCPGCTVVCSRKDALHRHIRVGHEHGLTWHFIAKAKKAKKARK
ncbi:hypothetical protein BC834DRAFT_911746 [Gloeopeniophorella convolvens]|nr:hypothetical protein BC834DRAFT_919590 [Gloeopeniophorella convolvens]KAI0258356.1 hypothetical protein BC834DRAFT_911746 [Gloeopeniophorella convolvens]